MGISVSESNAVKEQKMKSQLKRQLKKEQIRSELANGPSEISWKNRDKQNVQKHPASEIQPRSNNDHNRNPQKNIQDEWLRKQRQKKGIGIGRIEDKTWGKNNSKDQSDRIESGRSVQKGPINYIVARYDIHQDECLQEIPSKIPASTAKISPDKKTSIHRDIVSVQNIMEGGHMYTSPMKIGRNYGDEPPTTVPKSGGKEENYSRALHDQNYQQVVKQEEKVKISGTDNKGLHCKEEKKKILQIEENCLKFQKQKKIDNEENQAKNRKKRVSQPNVIFKNDSLSQPKIIVKGPESINNEFDHFDWTIPGEESIHDQMMKKDQLPSMNLVLSNKFHENVRNADDEQEAFKKHRRQMMRDLLAGKREGMEDPIFRIPSCRGVNIC